MKEMLPSDRQNVRLPEMLAKIIENPGQPVPVRKLNSALRAFNVVDDTSSVCVHRGKHDDERSIIELASTIRLLSMNRQPTQRLNFQQIDQLVVLGKAFSRRKTFHKLAQRSVVASASMALDWLERSPYLPPSSLRYLELAPNTRAILSSLMRDGPEQLVRRFMRSLLIMKCFKNSEKTFDLHIRSTLPRNVAPEVWCMRLEDAELAMDCIEWMVRHQSTLNLAARRQVIKALLLQLVEAGECRGLRLTLAKLAEHHAASHFDGVVLRYAQRLFEEAGARAGSRP